MSYVRHWPNFFESIDCRRVVRDLRSWEPHRYERSDGVPIETGGGSVSWKHPPSAKVFQEGVWHAIDQYVSEFSRNGFTGWSGYNIVRFNRYDPGQGMEDHVDHIHSLFDGERRGIPALTIVGLLNDDFTGGEFRVCDNILPLETGSVVIFPSVFLYPHSVAPVLTGTRYSWVSWAW
jgi:hypothetical protein